MGVARAEWAGASPVLSHAKFALRGLLVEGMGEETFGKPMPGWRSARKHPPNGAFQRADDAGIWTRKTPPGPTVGRSLPGGCRWAGVFWGGGGWGRCGGGEEGQMDGDVFLPHPSFLGALGGLGGLCVRFGCSGVREGGCSVVRGERFPEMDIPFVAAPPPSEGGGEGTKKRPGSRGGSGAGMVEAAGVEPASGNASPMLLRAYSAIGSSPCGLPADRPPAPPASCWVSSLFPEARNRDQPAE